LRQRWRERPVAEVAQLVNASASRRLVLTGGEPLLQQRVLKEFFARLAPDIIVEVETNGTIPLPAELDWVCVSPKADAPFVLKTGNELKLVFPQDGIDPAGLQALNFDHFWVQPMDGPASAANTEAAVAFCLANPIWRLSLQTHKVIGIP